MRYVRRLGYLAVLAVVLAACGQQTLPPEETSTLTLAITGSGTVTINGTATPAGNHDFETGTELTLAANAAAGWTFDGFSGDCTGATCNLTLDDDMAVTATFTEIPAIVTLSVSYLNGLGNGSVTSDVGGIACDFAAAGFSTSGTCDADVDAGTDVTLTATPGSGAEFVGWSGDAASCGATATCAVTVDNVKNAVARFSSDTATNGSAVVGATNSDASEFVTTPVAPVEPTSYVAGEVVINTYELPLAYWYIYDAEVVSAVRFVDLNIPAGAVITDAYIQFTSNMNRSLANSMNNDNAPLLIIKGESNVNAAAFVDSLAGNPNPKPVNGITSRTYVEQTAAWSPAAWGVKEQTVAQSTGDLAAPVPADLAPVLQAIIDLNGWTASDNAVVFSFSADPADEDVRDGYRNAADYRADDVEVTPGNFQDSAARLYFSYK